MRINEASRGSFAYWSEADEKAWKEKAPGNPVLPRFELAVSIRASPNVYAVHDDGFCTWDAMIEAGKSYMVGGSWATEAFIDACGHTPDPWLQGLFDWAMQNPFYKLVFSTPCEDWEVYKRREFVSFDLPTHGRGGEKNYVAKSRDYFVQVNED